MIARALTAPSQPRYDGDSENFIVADTTQITSRLNRSNPKAGDPCHPLPAHGHAPLLAHALSAEGHDASEDGTGRGVPMVVGALHPGHGGGAGHGYRNGDTSHIVGSVRRLTPIECERLQGFPDGFTCLCGADADWRACTCPDSPRYRACGNAVTVDIIEWIGSRLMEAMSP